jgi:hypothetical protein
MLLLDDDVPVPDAARALGTSEVAVPVRGGAADDDDVDDSRMTVLSRPRKSANRTRRISTATARIPSTPPGKVVLVVVVVVPVLRVTSVPVVVVCGAGVWAAASVPWAGALTLPVASVVAGVFVFWA